MGGEDLVVVMGVEIAFGAVEGEHLLAAHHQRIRKAAQQHHDAEDHVHDADALVVHRGEPFAPEIAPEAEIGEAGEQRGAAECDHREGADDDRLVQRQRFEAEPAEDELEKIRRHAGSL
ncbi:hypothetical protein ACVI8K_004108 [Bradyrhizobium barranii subsp. barranii]